MSMCVTAQSDQDIYIHIRFRRPITLKKLTQLKSEGALSDRDSESACEELWRIDGVLRVVFPGDEP